MSSVNRRRFIQLAGGTAALSALLSNSIARAAAIPANRATGSLQDVEHVVVLMQENRAFDHYFGTLRGVRGYGDPRPVTLPNGKPVFHQSDGTREILPFHPDTKNLGLQFLEGTPHDWNSGHKAWHQGAYDQWIPAKTPTTMAHLTRDDIPFHYALAETFTICDDYHCGLMGPTDPNRYYMWTGYTGNDGKGGGPVLTNDEVGYDWTTYPERLEQAGVSWKIYQDIGTGLDANGSWGWTNDAFIGNYGDNSLLYFDKYRTAAPGNPLYDKARTGTNVANGGTYFDSLRADVAAGTLPQVSWIVAPEAFTEHPNWPVNWGAWYTAKVLDALTANPDVWSKTALFLTYDENDGFFDHVVPPFAPAGPEQGASTADVSTEVFRPAAGDSHVTGSYGLGQRVPMIVVSPWSKGGFVNSQTLDHTSIIRFLEQRFGVHEPNISPWRRAICGDLTTAFDFAHTDVVMPSLPDTSAYVPADHDRHPSYVPVPPANPTMPQQETGTRPARPLPYDLAADGRVDAAGLHVDFASLGPIGANFLVTSPSRATQPWSYTVDAGRTLTGSFPVTAPYAFTVHGPNGFFRQFNGNPGTGPEVVVRHDGVSGQVHLTLTNAGTQPVQLTVTDAYGNDPAHTHRLAPGDTVAVNANTTGSNGWYDLSVTSTDAAYLRRLAGHVETGRPSTSDPAFAQR